MLKQRVLTAVLLAPAAVAAIFFLPLPAFIVFVSAIVLLSFWEWRQLVLSSSPIRIFAISTVILLASLYFLLPLPENGPQFDRFSISNLLLIIGGFWWLAIVAMVKRYPKSSKGWEKNPILQQCFGLLTLLPFMLSVLLLRAFQYNESPFLGAKLVLLVCILVWAADTGAYFAGRALGKHKLAPSVSPNKTIEGFVGGLIASVLAMLLAVKGFAIPFNSFSTLVFIAVITSLASVMGDLAESMFKRAAGIKDSGSILPGHGGILDRIDSLTAAFPVFTLLYFGLA